MKTARTIRRLPPITRKLAVALNDAEKAIKQASRRLAEVERIETECRAWDARQEHFKVRGEVDPLTLGELDRQVLSATTKKLPF
jgi:hypothetical protein